MKALKNLMLVDDDADDRDIFLSVIENLEPAVECLIATNGREALDKLAVSEILPEMIFLDLNMPLMGGKQFLSEINKHTNLKNIPVVILSTSSDNATITETKKLGAKDFIVKPDRYSGWVSTLKNYLESALLR